MTVSELIAELQKRPQDAEVRVIFFSEYTGGGNHVAVTSSKVSQNFWVKDNPGYVSVVCKSERYVKQEGEFIDNLTKQDGNS